MLTGECRRRPRRTPWSRAIARGWLVVGLLVVGTPALLAAHPALRRSVPAAGDTLTAPPRALRLTFSEAIEASLSSIMLLGPGDDTVRLSAPRPDAADPSVVTVSVMDSAPAPGRYAVVWKVTGPDGHPVRGRFSFVLVSSPPAAPGQPSPPAEHHPDETFPADEARFGVESPAYVAVRWLVFASLLALLGVVGFEYLVVRMVRRRAAPGSESALAIARARAARLGLAAAGLLLFSVAGRLVAQSVSMHEPGEALEAALLSAMLFRTMWGWGWLLQLAAAALALGAFLRVRRAPERRWTPALLATLALSVTPALAGHAMAVTGYGPIPVLADSLHVLGAGGWLGTLLVLVVAGLPAAMRQDAAERGPLVAELVNAFSPVALFFAGLVATTGVFSAWLHLGTVAELWQSAYGRTLLIKLAVLAVVAGTGFYNWRRVRPALGDEVGTRRVRRSSTVELVVAAAVILVTAVLVAMPPPADVTANAAHAVSVPTNPPTEVLR
jgi:putative copper export protein/methionine-rich copper-binding protein CopC